MDVIEKKYPAQKLSPYLKILKWNRNKLQLLGTGGNASQLYPSDIDLFCKIEDKKTTADYAYNKVIEMLTKAAERPDMFLIEGKIQQKDGDKHKWKTLDELQSDTGKMMFDKYFTDDIDYVKYDFVLFLGGTFIELSAIYVFNKDPLDYDKLKLSLSNDLIDLVKEGKFYKSLKRLFAILKLDDNVVPRQQLIKISELFNGDIGALYKKNSVLKAVELYLESYNDEEGQRMAERVFHNVMGNKMALSSMPKIIKKYDKLINEAGKKFLNENYPMLLQIKDLKGKPILLEGFGRPIHQSAIVHNDLVGSGKAEGGHPLAVMMGGGSFRSNTIPTTMNDRSRLLAQNNAQSLENIKAVVRGQKNARANKNAIAIAMSGAGAGTAFQSLPYYNQQYIGSGLSAPISYL